MIDFLYTLDLWLFSIGNKALANPVFDFLLPILTNERYMVPLYVLALLVVMWKGGRIGRIAVVLAVLTVVVADLFNAVVLKELVGRIRPCSALSDVRLLVPCGAGKSFPSNHAVNNSAAAVILGFFFPGSARYLAAYAVLIAYSRVYCGVHYPLDVFAGLIEGSIVGFLAILGWYHAFSRVPALALPSSPLELFRRGKTSDAAQ